MEFEKNNIYYYVPRLSEEKDTQLLKRVEKYLNYGIIINIIIINGMKIFKKKYIILKTINKVKII